MQCKLTRQTLGKEGEYIMVTNMVAASVSGMAADIERRWMEQLLQNTAAVPARASSEISGFYGLTQKAEQEWLSLLGARA
jgi:hypothetical protein